MYWAAVCDHPELLPKKTQRRLATRQMLLCKQSTWGQLYDLTKRRENILELKRIRWCPTSRRFEPRSWLHELGHTGLGRPVASDKEHFHHPGEPYTAYYVIMRLYIRAAEASVRPSRLLYFAEKTLTLSKSELRRHQNAGHDNPCEYYVTTWYFSHQKPAVLCMWT